MPELRQRACRFRQPRDPEVDQMRRAVIVEHHVTGFDVAVNHASTVSVVQRARHLFEQIGYLAHGRQPPLVLFDALGQRAAGQQLHYEVVDALLRTKVINVDDVRVFESSRGFGFPVEPFDSPGLLRELRGQHLDGDVPFQGALVAFVDGPHTPHAEQLAQFILPEALTGQILDAHIMTRNP